MHEIPSLHIKSQMKWGKGSAKPVSLALSSFFVYSSLIRQIRPHVHRRGGNINASCFVGLYALNDRHEVCSSSRSELNLKLRSRTLCNSFWFSLVCPIYSILRASFSSPFIVTYMWFQFLFCMCRAAQREAEWSKETFSANLTNWCANIYKSKNDVYFGLLVFGVC